MYSGKGVPGITTVLEAFRRDVCHDDRPLDPHNVEEAVDHHTRALSVVSTDSHHVQKETVDGGGVHRVATATSITVRPRPRMANILISAFFSCCVATAPDFFLSGRWTWSRFRRSGSEEKPDASQKVTSSSFRLPSIHALSHLALLTPHG